MYTGVEIEEGLYADPSSHGNLCPSWMMACKQTVQKERDLAQRIWEKKTLLGYWWLMVSRKETVLHSELTWISHNLIHPNHRWSFKGICQNLHTFFFQFLNFSLKPKCFPFESCEHEVRRFSLVWTNIRIKMYQASSPLALTWILKNYRDSHSSKG